MSLLGLKAGLLFLIQGYFHYVNQWLPSKKNSISIFTCTAISPPVTFGSVPFLDTRNNLIPIAFAWLWLFPKIIPLPLLRSLSLHSQWGEGVPDGAMKLSRRREPRKGGTEEACRASCASPGAFCPSLWFLVISTPHLLPWVTNLSIAWIPRPLSLLSLISLSFLDSYPDPLLLWITARGGKCNYKDLDVLPCAAEHDLTVEAHHTALWRTLINFLCFSCYQIQTTVLMALKWSATAAP